MKRFAKLFDQLDQTQSTNEKVNFLKEYFLEAPAKDAVWGLFFLSGRRIKRFIGSKFLKEWCLEKKGLTEWLYHECLGTVGDTAETIALLLANAEKSTFESDIPLSDWMEKRILPLKQLSDEQKKEAISQWWDETNVTECFLLNKILTGSFRVGVSHLLTLRALEKATESSKVVLSQKLLGEWDATETFFKALFHQTYWPQKEFSPYPFFLASPLDKLEDLGKESQWFAEWKWDGIRGQLVYRQGVAHLWSRGMELVSEQFPEIIDAVHELPFSCVLDGEILAYKEGKPLHFGQLQRRLGRKKISQELLNEVPVVFMAYDLMEESGEDVRELPLKVRRKRLEKLLSKADSPFLISPLIEFNHWHELTALRKQSRELNTEGIMLKNKDSIYGIGRQRGQWWKYKIDPLTVDAVLIYAQPGSGRRSGLYTDYTFGVWHEGELIPIAKAYSGLSQEEINELDKWIRKNTEEKFGPVRKVKAYHVFELAFEAIQVSNRHKSGVALRFPRIARWRKDKPFKEADQLEFLKQWLRH